MEPTDNQDDLQMKIWKEINEKRAKEEATKPLSERILITIEGEDRWAMAYTLVNAAKLLRKSYRGLQLIIKNRGRAGHPIQLYEPIIGKGTYILEENLMDLLRAVPKE